MKKLSLLFILCQCTVQAQSTTLSKGNHLYAAGNYTKAIEAYKSLNNKTEMFPKIAKAYTAIGNYDQALAYYKKAIEINPNHPVLKYDYAKLLFRTKNYDDAKTLFQNLIINDSLNPNYHYELGIVLEKQHDTLAVEKFNSVYNLDSTHQKAIFKIAKHCIIKRKFKNAHSYIDKGLESYSNNIELISLKAQAYYYQEYYTHAVVWFNKLIDLGESSEFIHEKLSLSYAHNSDYNDAIKHRKLALKFSPNDANTIFVIGTYYERLGNFEEAERYISNALKIQDISLTEEYQKLGTILIGKKNIKQRLKLFRNL